MSNASFKALRALLNILVENHTNNGIATRETSARLSITPLNRSSERRNGSSAPAAEGIRA